MPELEDLRGRTLSWLRNRDRPLLCQLYEASEIIGAISHNGAIAPTYAEFAGVKWRIESTRRRLRKIDRVGFGSRGPLIAECTTDWDFYMRLIHTLTIDESEAYTLHQSDEQRATWHDKAGREVVSFRKLGVSRDAGEIFVSGSVSLPHAPILVLVGVLRSLRGTTFAPHD